MPDLTSELINKIESLVGKWTSYTAFATFVLYLVGYLTLRFQLSVYGIATNLDVFDEKYLFAGCRFLVYLVSEVPVVLLVMMFMTPLTAFAPQIVPPGPRITSIRSMSSSGRSRVSQ